MIRRIAFGLVLLLAACAAEPQGVVPEAGQEQLVRRLAALLDYVAADYGGAVANGEIVAPGEYAEQIAFLKGASDYAARLTPPDATLAGRLAAIHAQVSQKAPATEVAAACRTLRRDLLASRGVVIAPAVPPSRERGAELYASACASCHGATGAGDGPGAKGLDPAPRSFLDPTILADLSPARSFSALTDGIEGTAMASFGTLSASDRWSLAFHVSALRHTADAATRGAQIVGGLAQRVGATPSRLAGQTDAELLAEVTAAGATAAQAGDALAFLRADAPYRRSGAPFDTARAMLAAVVAQAQGGDPGGARQALDGAYLDGFEPYEAALSARDPELIPTVERQFLDLRAALDGNAPPDRIERNVLQLQALLDRGDAALAGGGARMVFAASLLVVLREGLEAALLLLLLLGLVARADGSPRDTRAVHAGWVAAVTLGVITWFASGLLLGLGAANREWVEGVISLVAAVVLLFAGHYVLARLDARRRVDALMRRFQSATPARRQLILFGLGFVAVYREAFEVVLFLRAIALEATGGSSLVLGGALAGLAVCFVLVVLLKRLGRRLSPGKILAASGFLLCVLAVVLVGKGVRSLQEAGAVDIHPLAGPRVDWLGFYPTIEGVAAQVVVLLAFVGIALVATLRAVGDAPAVPDASKSASGSAS